MNHTALGHSPAASQNSRIRLYRKLLIGFLAVVGGITLTSLLWLTIALELWKLPSAPAVAPAIGRQLGLSPLSAAEQSSAERYLDLLKKYLVRYDFGTQYRPINVRASRTRRLVGDFLLRHGLVLARVLPETPAMRETGEDWPSTAETMIGLERLANIQQCAVDVIRRKVPGDLIECGAWRGGATIFMRAILQTYGVKDRNVWVADSFQGVPKPDEKNYPADNGIALWKANELAVSVDQVKANFRRYGLLDDQVKFLAGWFKDSLPKAPIQRLSILRVDADLYESTWEALQYLYPKLSVGGYCIVDDYGALPACRKAVEDFRRINNIRSELKKIDWTGVYWRREN